MAKEKQKPYEFLSNLVSVSYTHLDVYKRQHNYAPYTYPIQAKDTREFVNSVKCVTDDGYIDWYADGFERIGFRSCQYCRYTECRYDEMCIRDRVGAASITAISVSAFSTI